jgi:uncharacterized protein (UPF0276 family)
MSESGDDASTIPATIGIGLRAPHLAEIIATHPVVGWLEVHPENYLGGGGAAPARLATVCRDYPLSLHGVGLSLGSAEGIDAEHLARVKALIDRAQPFIVSEHLSWSVTGGTYLNDLLPLPYTEESLDVVATNVARLQEALGRRVLVENPSSYLRFQHSTVAEPDFLAALVRRSGCGLLCDVNNIFVTSSNLGLDAAAYLDALPVAAVGEIHLAGHATVTRGDRVLLIDDHGSSVAPGLGALWPCARTLRLSAEPHRMGQEFAAARDRARRSAHRRRRRAASDRCRCLRCVTCRRRSPAPCSPMTPDRSRR